MGTATRSKENLHSPKADLTCGSFGAGDRGRTGDLHLGKVNKGLPVCLPISVLWQVRGHIRVSVIVVYLRLFSFLLCTKCGPSLRLAPKHTRSMIPGEARVCSLKGLAEDCRRVLCSKTCRRS